MNRRAFLTVAPAATLGLHVDAAASAVCQTVPSLHDQTPIARLFAKWQWLNARSNEPGISDDELDRRTDAEIAIEREIRRTPAVTAQDLAKKALIDVGFGDFEVSDPFWSEVCNLAGVPVSRLARHGF